MVAGRASFEIQTFHDGHWITSDYRETELTARAQAKTLFSMPDAEGVRVVKNWTRSDGVVTENVLYTAMRDPVAPKVTIVPIDESPYCRETREYYRWESRATMNRLFRKYVDQVFLTPTELIHHYKSLKRIQEVETLFPAAVDRIATIQSRHTGEESRSRRDEIFRALAQMTDRARRAEDYPRLPKLSGNNFERLCERMEGAVPPGEADYFSLVVLSRELVKHRNWLGKLDRLTEFARPDQRREALTLLDGVFADIFGVASALQDVLGYQQNLAEAICAMIDLCEGRFQADRSDARDQVSAIAPLIADGRFAETRHALLDRAIRQLGGVQPLSRNDPSREEEAFLRVARRLLGADHLIGAGAAAEALTQRAISFQEAGGRSGLRRAIGIVVKLLGDPVPAVSYLVELAGSSLGRDLSQDIGGALQTVLGVGQLDDLVAPSMRVVDKLSRVTGIYERVLLATGLPAEGREGVLAHIDGLLSAYVRREGVIEKLDHPDAGLRDRAIRLIEFCAAGYLPAGSRAVEIARGRVVDLLRQPNFEQRFVDGLSDPDRRETVLRSFHALLARAGFG
ncbi:MAG: hypothetical protein F8N37_17480 [Telmatospirillum sp.]|nr:hypothetical protein [Telmatospirillum sp.]